MKRAIMVLTLSLIVGWTTAAAAECAWVLWSHFTARDINIPLAATSLWVVWHGHPTHGECTAERHREFRLQAAVFRAQPGTKDFTQNPSNAALTFMRQGKRHSITYRCLPDTIDPREKKE